MTREIKARVWDKLEGCWKYITMGRESLNPVHYDFDTMGLYIGKKDKNGVEICEGDIYKYGDKVGVLKDIGDLFFEDSLFYPLGTGDVEIIGNIHEPPELLEETKCPK